MAPEIINPAKDAAFRFGATAKIGIEGRLTGQWFLNINWAYGFMNLIGRQEKTGQPLEHGELLTPKLDIQPEFEEKLIQNYLFQFLLQYRI